MAWSKITGNKRKSIWWWYHKVLCEIGYHAFGGNSKMYHSHLAVMCDVYGFNLYGETHYISHRALNFKGIKSTSFANDGTRLVSGQKVICCGRINQNQLVEVFFEPSYGFMIQGNNLSDAYVSLVVEDVPLWAKIKGNFRLLAYNLFNFYSR